MVKVRQTIKRYSGIKLNKLLCILIEWYHRHNQDRVLFDYYTRRCTFVSFYE
jgi:hypothetical protein